MALVLTQKIKIRFLNVFIVKTIHIQAKFLARLGLAIVQTEVNKYHGKIVLKDNTPQGSIFIVSLPQK